MFKGVRAFVFWCIVACILAGCGTHYQWTKSHPAYTIPPFKDFAVIGAEKAFVLNRSAWFAKKLNIPAEEIQKHVTGDCAKWLVQDLQKLYPEMNALPASLMDAAPEESQQLDSRIFIKGKIPEQGIILKDSTGYTPARILIIHEAILGTDLNREDFFDYALIHNESPEKKTSKNLTAIVSYTLWDNEKQRALFNSIDQIDRPITHLSMTDMEQLVQSIVESIRSHLVEGAGL